MPQQITQKNIAKKKNTMEWVSLFFFFFFSLSLCSSHKSGPLELLKTK